MPVFRTDAQFTRQIGFLDLLFACLIALVILPALAFALGYAILFASGGSGPALLEAPVALLVGFGYTGLFAWAGTPIALLAGWWATRTGRLGWGSALLLGTLGGALFSLPFIGATDVRLIDREVLAIAAFFCALGAVYGLAGYLALRWLRADILRKAR